MHICLWFDFLANFLFLSMSCESDAKSCGCDFFPVHECDVSLCHHCICVHFRRTRESQVKRCCAQISDHIGLHRLSTAQIPHSHPLAAPGNQFEKVVIENAREKAPSFGMSRCSSRARTDVHLGTSKWQERNAVRDPTWKRWMQQVVLEKPTQVWDQVYLGCTQRVCQPNKKSL